MQGVAHHGVGEVDEPRQTTSVAIDQDVIRADVVVHEPPRTILGRFGNGASEVGLGPTEEVVDEQRPHGVCHVDQLGSPGAPGLVLPVGRRGRDAIRVDAVETGEHQAEVLGQPGRVR